MKYTEQQKEILKNLFEDYVGFAEQIKLPEEDIKETFRDGHNCLMIDDKDFFDNNHIHHFNNKFYFISYKRTESKAYILLDRYTDKFRFMLSMAGVKL